MLVPDAIVQSSTTKIRAREIRKIISVLNIEMSGMIKWGVDNAKCYKMKCYKRSHHVLHVFYLHNTCPRRAGTAAEILTISSDYLKA